MKRRDLRAENGRLFRALKAANAENALLRHELALVQADRDRLMLADQYAIDWQRDRWSRPTATTTGWGPS